MIRRSLIALLPVLASVLFVSTAKADDTEVYINPATAALVPNIMFVLDLSASMNKKPDGTNPGAGEDSRLDILKQAINDVLDSDLPDVNVGLSTFTKDRASGIKWPTLAKDADASNWDPNIPAGTSVSDVIKFMVDDAVGTGFTPTVDQLYEVTRYFRGMTPLAPENHRFGTWNTTHNAYRGGWSNPAGWKAVNPIAHTGGLVYVDPNGPRRWKDRYCNDYSGRTPPEANQCADELAEGLILECDTIAAVPARVCTEAQCDNGCGTYNRCEDAFGNSVDLTYTEPNNCLTLPNGNTWVTSTTGNGTPRRCCKTSDSGGTECTGHQWYSSQCPAPASNVSRCKTWNATGGRQAYERCYTGLADTRQYISPITQQCQKSAIVLLTDGDPSINRWDYGRLNGNGTARTPWNIRDMIFEDLGGGNGDPDTVTCADQSTFFGAAPWSQAYGNCAIELADHINTVDQVPAVLGSTIETHTIGFGLSGPVANETWGYLQRIATAGGGLSYQADDLVTLTESFENVINSLASGNQSFRNFSATFDVATLATGNRAFLSMFGPTEYQAWDGNLKGYFLKPDGLYDVNDNAATEVDAISGEVVFKPTAKSFWSTVIDGNTPQSGGFVGGLTPATRNLYVLTDVNERANVDLNDGAHDLDVNNATLTDTLMGMPAGSSAAQREALIDYARSQRMGDPLHTRSRIVDYGGVTGNVLFLGTNQGFIHAVDINAPTSVGQVGGGNEIFAFMPYESVGNLHGQNQVVAGAHLYGVDGPVTVWRQDKDANGVIDGADKVYLYFGLRRGGSAYYALDVTDPTDPQVMWKIDANSAGFGAMGQSWSKMQLADLQEGTDPRKVLIFGGGYDTAQDVAGIARPAGGNTQGVGVYVVDAETGALHASIGPNAVDFDYSHANLQQMKYAIPADIKIEDTDNNGIDDRLYFGDMGGQVWRIDIDQDNAFNTKFKGYMLADFGVDASDNATDATNRRLYYSPSVARYTRGGNFVYAITIGSGYRGHPLDDHISDKLFAFFDTNASVGSPNPTPTPITIDDLFDATSDILTTGDETQQDTAQTALEGSAGWFISLAATEKVLARTRIFRNRVLFTTFSPESSGGVCDVSSTTNRLYAVNLADATPAFPVDTNGDGVMDDFTRSKIVADQAMILDEPMIVTYHNPGNPNPAEGEVAEAPSTCAGVYGGAQRMLTLCSSPVKVNWNTLQ